MMGFPLFWLLEGQIMKKIRMCVDTDKTFAEGFEEYILDCKSRNLRDGTLRHYRESIKQIYKRVPPDTLISDLFRPVFNHRQVSACNSRKAAQHILGNSLFFAEVSNCLSNSKVIELHTITSFLFHSLREKEVI